MAYQRVYLGRQIGNYRISSELASGSFGSVFLAHHLYLKQRVVVIKILHAVHLGSEEEKEQFLQEAQILEMLKGLPHILPLFDVGIDGATPYLITEYAERGSLRLRVRQHLPATFSTSEVLTILAQVGQGLQAAHDRNIVHRDLKPENILFNARGEALLADFGISTVLSTASVKYTEILGTPAYMAPEQFRGEVSKESDQYALACIAYELLTGSKPFNAPDFVAMGFLHTSERPVAPREHNVQIPVNIDQAILKALSKQRRERFASVTDFLHALEQSQAAQAPTIYATPPFVAQNPPMPRAVRGKTTPLSVSDLPAEAYGPHASPTVAGVPFSQEVQVEMSGQKQAQQPIHLSASPYADGGPYATPYAGAGQVSVQQQYAPPTPRDGGYIAVQANQMYQAAGPDPFLDLNFGMRLMAALCYVLPILLWIIALVDGRRNRFVRFHWMQAMLGWLLWFICNLLFNTHTVQDHTTSPLFSIISLILFVLGLRLTYMALRGRYSRIWVLGTLAEKFANRRPR